MFLVDGFRTIVTMSALPGVALHEKEITPIGYEGGGSIDTTTMRNGQVAAIGLNPGQGVSSVRTFAPKSLVTVAEMTFTAKYDPRVLADILTVMNVIQQFTVTFPDNATASFFGWIDSFKPQTLKEGDLPLAEVKIIPTGTVAGSGGNVIPGVPTFTAGNLQGVLAR